VDGGILNRLFGRAGNVSPEIAATLDELAQLARTNPTLAGPAQLLAAVLPGLHAAPVTETPPVLSPGQATAKLAGGIPLLRGESLAIDVAAFRRRWLHVCTAIQGHRDDDAVTGLANAMRHGRLDPRELTQDTLAGRPEAIHTRADALGLDAGLTATVLRLTLFPVLASINSVLQPLRERITWQYGFCPTCGSWPILGEFRGMEQTRVLRCGLCAGAWEFERLRCTYCGTTDHRQLGYFHVEGEEGKYRAVTCDVCRGYGKMLSTFTALSPTQLLAADVATLHLDLVAAERGYAVHSV
jgi:FdhE protein